VTTEGRPPENQADGKAIPEPVRETTSPSGIDLRPQPEKSVRISKRAAALIVIAGAGVLGLFAYGGLKREQQRAAAAHGSPYKKVEPARPDELQQELNNSASGTARAGVRAGLVPAVPDDPNQLQGPDSDLPRERVVVRRATALRPAEGPTAPLAPVTREPTPEEKALSVAYMAEQQARLAPTGIRAEFPNVSITSQATTVPSAPGTGSGSPLETLVSALTPRNPDRNGPVPLAGMNGNSEYDGQNLQTEKESFLQKARTGNIMDDYLKYTRTPPLSRFEIKAGWEIPAALEQGLNSDLPGELKALVMSNVYDTATGQYLLIPQGARLVGEYNSRVAFGQSGVQVAWHRVIFPDGSAIDLNGMEGLDAQGNAGLRDKVDHHYRQLFGVAVLTTMFDAALAVTQSRQQSVLLYPSPAQETEGAAGREVSQLGTQMARKNLNVQPTIKVPAGYKFNVRVNRDILFEEPYQALQPVVNDGSALVRNARESR
jgi:type IV secretion system protein TrbI